jgi:hypothetical protein
MEDIANHFNRQEPIKGLNLVIGSPPDREKLVAELYDGNVQWGELQNETGRLILEVHPEPNGLFWEFSFEELMKLLQQAERELTGRTGGWYTGGTIQ